MKNFEHLFVPKDLADKLHDFGFADKTLYYWVPNVNIKPKKGEKFNLVHKDVYIGNAEFPISTQVKRNVYQKTIPAPLLEEVCDWLYKRHNIYVSSTFSKGNGCDCIIDYDYGFSMTGYKKTKGEALIVGIEKALDKAINFWYESNACWGNVYNVEDLLEKAKYQLVENNGIDTLDDFLDKSLQCEDRNNYGTYSEHKGPKTLRMYLEEKGYLLHFISRAIQTDLIKIRK